MMLIGLFPLGVITGKVEAASPGGVYLAIIKGITYLASIQKSDGSWPRPSGQDAIATTAMAVLAFENAHHLPGNVSDPYHMNVTNGLNYLLSQARVQAIGPRPTGNPDTSGDGIGIYFDDFIDGGASVSCYETPMVLMTLVGSGNASRAATTGPANVTGRTYHDIATDIVDWLAWAQNDNTTGIYEGGWRYHPFYGSSDMSVTQWVVLGLLTAELWNINAPSWVPKELAKWLAVDQDLTGNPTSNYFYGCFYYEPSNQLDDVADSAAGILGLTYCGVNTTDPRIIAAEGYITRDWYTTQGTGGWRNNFGDFYAMYSIMKTMELTLPVPTKYIENYSGTPTIEWFNGTNQYADWLIANQYSKGYWLGTNNPEEDTTGQNLDTAWATLILEHIPVIVKYPLVVQVVDAYTNEPISAAVVSLIGLENQTATTGADGTVFFNESLAGSCLISVSKTGYITAEKTADLTQIEYMTMQLAQAGPFRLNVNVVNSCNQPISNASVKVANNTVLSDASGIASFVLPRGYYNVSASHSHYQASFYIADLVTWNENVTLTLGFPYTFVGEIPTSNIILTPVSSGYNITLLNSLASSQMDVFIEWNYVGTIPAGSWQSFSFNHLPALIVEAASEGTPDYPNAWYKHPLPIELPPINGTEGAFLPAPTPYVDTNIFVNPNPPVYGENATISVRLHNPSNNPMHISRVDFQLSGLTVGGYFSSVGNVNNVTLQVNETRVFSIEWLVNVTGHHCVRIVLTYSPESQTAQLNLDVESNLVAGRSGTVTFTLVNPDPTSEIMDVHVTSNLPTGWYYTLEMNSYTYDMRPKDIAIPMAADERLTCVLFMASDSAYPGTGEVDVAGYINNELIGGLRKQLQTYALSSIPVQVTAGSGGSVTVQSSGISNGAPVTVNGGNTQTFHLLLGTALQLQATASQGYSFGSWTENGVTSSGGSSVTISITGSISIVANFISTSGTAPPTGGGSSQSGAMLNIESSLIKADNGYNFTLQIAPKGGSTWLMFTEDDINALKSVIYGQLAQAGLSSLGSSNVLVAVTSQDVVPQNAIKLLDAIISFSALGDSIDDNVQAFGTAKGLAISTLDVVTDQTVLPTLPNPPEIVTTYVNGMLKATTEGVEYNLLNTFTICLGSAPYKPSYIVGPGQGLEIVVTDLKSPSQNSVTLNLAGSNAVIRSTTVGMLQPEQTPIGPGYQATSGFFSVAITLNKDSWWSQDYHFTAEDVQDPLMQFIKAVTNNLLLNDIAYNSSSASMTALATVPTSSPGGRSNVSFLIPPELDPTGSSSFSLTLNGTTIPFNLSYVQSAGFLMNATITHNGTLTLLIPSLPPSITLSIVSGILFVSGSGFAPNSTMSLQYYDGGGWTDLAGSRSFSSSSDGYFVYQITAPTTQPSGVLMVMATDTDNSTAISSIASIDLLSFTASPPSPAGIDTLVTLTVVAKSAAGAKLLYRFSTDCGATWDSWNSSNTFGFFTDNGQGYYTFLVEVTDGLNPLVDGPPITYQVSATAHSVVISPSSVILDLASAPKSQTFISTASGGVSPYYYQWYLNGNPIAGATSVAWTFSPTSPGLYTIYLNVTDGTGTWVESNIALVTVNPPLSVGVLPGSVILDVGQSQLFTSTASGGTNSYIYQWYLNGASVLGATGATWTYTPSSAGSNFVYLKVTDTLGVTATSNTVPVTANTAPSVTILPVSVSIDIGGSQLFTSAVVGGTSSYAYKWYLNGIEVPGATNATWTFSSASSGSYNVYLEINDSAGFVAKSNTVLVTVNGPVSVAISPGSATFDVGQSQLFTSTITGGTGPFSYQWYLNGTMVRGAMHSSWTFSCNSTGFYTVYLEVNDSLGASGISPTSNATVNSQPAVIIGPSSAIIYLGQSQLFTSSVSGGTGSFSYQWYLNGTLVRGATSSSWVLTPNSTGTCKVYLTVTDSVNMAKSSTASVLTVNPLPSVIITPTSVTIDVNQSRSFASTVSGRTPPYTFQWYLNSSLIPGANSSSWTFKPTSQGIYGVWVEVIDSLGMKATSNTAYVTVNGIPSATILPGSVTIDVGQSQLFTSFVSGGTGSFSYQWYLNGTLVSGATSSTWTLRSTSVGFYTVYLKVADSLGAGSASSISNVTVNPRPTVIISPRSATIDVGQSQLFTSFVSGGTGSFSYQWYLNGTLVPGATSSTWTFTPTLVGTYEVYLKVKDSVMATNTSNTAIVTVNPIPSVIIDPTSVTVDLGQSQNFTSTVFGHTPPYTFQWYQNSSLITGANSSSWVFSPTSPGIYRLYVVVTDLHGEEATSNTANVRANAMPSVTISPVSVTLDVGQKQVFSSIVFDGTSPYYCQWYLNDVAVLGATNSTWTFVPASVGSYMVYLNVTDSVGVIAISSVSNVIVHHPSISVSKSGPSYAYEGTMITYTITVTNTGDCALYNVNVTDNVLGPIWTGVLDTGAVKVFTVECAVPISPSTIISDTVTAVGHDALSMEVSGKASWTVTVLHPAVTISPSSATIDLGQSEAFTSAASNGTSPYSYQWYLDGVTVSGAAGATWTFVSASAGSHTVYLNVTDSVGVIAISKTATVKVNGVPSVTISPNPITMDVGQSRLFTSTVFNGTSPYYYQWYLNGVPVLGATNSTWTFTPSSPISYNVYVNITDSAGLAAESNIATVTVNPALSVGISPASVVLDAGQSPLFTSTVSLGTPPYSYQWYLNSALVAGANGTTWTPITPSAGSYTVHLVVTDDVGAKKTSNTATITVHGPLFVTVSPASVIQGVFQSQLFNSTVSGGTSAYSYQWYFNDTLVPGATSVTWTFPSSPAGVYTVYVEVTDGVGVQATSNTVAIIRVAVISVGSLVGITGYKLVFKETMSNSLASSATIDYYWNFSVDKWNGAQWVATAISVSSTPVAGYAIPNSTIVDLPYYVYPLPSSGQNAVAWGDWLRISFTFHWTYSGTTYSTDYSAKLNVHPGDIAGTAVTFPYLGADGKIGLADLMAVAFHWNAKVAWTGSINPLDAVHIADIDMSGRIGIVDLMAVAFHWNQQWTNTPPPG
jgi:hypothetical protein